MKMNEISVESQIDEIPAGGVGQMAKKVGSKILNKLPGAAAKSKASNLAGKADLGDTANNLHKEFNQFVGQQGKNIKSATGEDFSAFLKTKKHKTKAKIPSGPLQKNQLNDLLMAVSKEAAPGVTPQAQKAAPAAQAGKDASNAKNIAQKVAQGAKTIGQKIGAKGSGQQMSKAMDKVAQGKALPANLAKQISPFAKQLEAILGNTQLRPKFMTLVKQAEKLSAKAGAVPAAKAKTGGKVAGQVSQTPNAIRKRAARATAKV